MLGLSKIIGVAGLLFVTGGVLLKDRRKQDVLFIFGGILLETYSILIGDPIFMILQAIFTIAAVYDYIKLR